MWLEPVGDAAFASADVEKHGQTPAVPSMTHVPVEMGGGGEGGGGEGGGGDGAGTRSTTVGSSKTVTLVAAAATGESPNVAPRLLWFTSARTHCKACAFSGVSTNTVTPVMGVFACPGCVGARYACTSPMPPGSLSTPSMTWTPKSHGVNPAAALAAASEMNLATTASIQGGLYGVRIVMCSSSRRWRRVRVRCSISGCSSRQLATAVAMV